MRPLSYLLHRDDFPVSPKRFPARWGGESTAKAATARWI
jgi:hypothetical protein